MKKRAICILLAAIMLVGMMPAASADGSIITHTVKSGDMIETICAQYDVDYYACYYCIMKLNGFTRSSQLEWLYVGQTIKLPATKEISEKIMSGELDINGNVPSAAPEATPAPSAAPGSAASDGDYKIIEHTVGEWDVLIRVCDSYGLNFYNVKAAIMKLNGYTKEDQLNVLTPGKIIKLPASEADAKKIMASGSGSSSGTSGSTGSGVSYVVKAGDTFISICEANGLNFFAIKAQLMQLNGFKSESQLNNLRVGQTVKLPGSAAPSTPSTPTAPDKPAEPDKPSEPTTPAEPAKPAEYKTITHTITDSDILINVCNKYGMSFYAVKDAIMKLNGFTSERQLDILTPGKTIKLPASEADAKVILSSAGTSAPSGGGSGSTAGSSAPVADKAAYYLVPYTFQPGDTVYNICVSMGIDFDANSELIKKLNSIGDYRRISNGKVLLLPSSKQPDSGNFYKVVSHKISSGETIEGIVGSYWQDYSKIQNLMKIINGKDSFDMIYAGATLLVPVYCKA